jgi:pimeloyl-ACP methyl ester carboxylesterase
MLKTLLKLYLFASTLFLSGQCLGQTKIDTTESIQVGGIKQVVTLQGEDHSKPLFLFITGGPGLPGIYDENKLFTNELKKHFVVVQWDQRNCGQTLTLNPSPVKLTVKLFKLDTHELVTSLLKQFHRQKLFLMSWSWGTVLGFYMADNYPGQLYAFMAVSPMVNQWESERILIKELRQKAAKRKNLRAIKELSKVQIPFANGLQNYYDRKWLLLFNGEDIGDTTEFKKYFTENDQMINLSRAASNNNLMVSLPEIKCPVYFFVGRKDHQTNYLLSAQYYKELKAPKKELFWFEKSGHLIPKSEPGLLQNDVVFKILPQVLTK